MEHAVALVRSYLHVNGFFTVTEYPVLELDGPGRFQAATDIDLVAFRLPGAGGLTAAGGKPVGLPFEPDPALGVAADRAEMLIAEVKHGKAELNRGARDRGVLRSVLTRFGFCPASDVERVVERLSSRGSAELPSGVRVRLVAFGSLPGRGLRGAHRVLLGDVLAYLDQHLDRHWAALRTTQITDPAFGFLAMLKKAREAGRPAAGKE